MSRLLNEPGFIVNIASQLEANQVEEIADEDLPPGPYMTHLYPSNCPNIRSAMKALINGFVNRRPDGQDIKRKSATSLANDDIELLKVWHGVLRDATGKPWIMTSLVEIVASYVPQLPLIFVLALSPPHPSFPHATFPQSVPSLLRVDAFTVLSGAGFLERTFFDLDFGPDVMVGPATLDFLTDFRCCISIPLTIFVQDEQSRTTGTSSADLATKKPSDPNAAPFLTSLFSSPFSPQELSSSEEGWPVDDVSGLLAS
ncbi:hypothetical protein BJV78DRAFT_1281383 [Lactifluus subvellereus]|nr:hypothetical protein BJV78DRAFT_1281383 [Lactifluus subvellereus]